MVVVSDWCCLPFIIAARSFVETAALRSISQATQCDVSCKKGRPSFQSCSVENEEISFISNDFVFSTKQRNIINFYILAVRNRYEYYH